MIEYTNEKFLEFRDYIKKSRSFAVTGLTSILRILLVKQIYEKKKILFVTSTEQNALKFQNDFKKIFESHKGLLTAQVLLLVVSIALFIFSLLNRIFLW